MGNRPNTSMENMVREKTWVVEGSREASTVDAMRAELVEMDAGRLAVLSNYRMVTSHQLTARHSYYYSRRKPHS